MCEFVPSGTKPTTSALASPTTWAMRLVIGATVETTRSGRYLMAVSATQF